MTRRIRFLLAVPFVLGLGAQEPQYEMTKYVMGMLRKGPNWKGDNTAESQRIQEGHMANIQKMAAMGKLVVAGPFEGNNDMRGVFIFHNTTLEEARALTENDPAIKTGRLVLDLYSWYAAAGLRVNDPKSP